MLYWVFLPESERMRFICVQQYFGSLDTTPPQPPAPLPTSNHHRCECVEIYHQDFTRRALRFLQANRVCVCCDNTHPPGFAHKRTAARWFSEIASIPIITPLSLPLPYPLL